MKRNCIVRSWIILLVLAAAGCKEGEDHAGEHRELPLSESVQGLTGSVNERILASAPDVQVESGSRIIETQWQGRIGYDARQQIRLSSRVAGRIERMHVRYNYQPVKKGQLIMEVYSPDLVAAQRELLFLAREKQSDLQQSAVQKLLYMGMTEAQINRVLVSRQPLYRVGVYSPVSGFITESVIDYSPEGSSPALNLREGQYVAMGDPVLFIYKNESVVAEFSLTTEEAVSVRIGQSILLDSRKEKGSYIPSKVVLLEPVIRNGESFSTARAYLPAGEFAIGEMVKASVPLVVRQGWWLPESSIVDLGGESVVFVRKGDLYSPERVMTAQKFKGYVQVLSDLEGQSVARDAAYLVDSESFINHRK